MNQLKHYSIRGVDYTKQRTKKLDKALQLDPSNVDIFCEIKDRAEKTIPPRSKAALESIHHKDNVSRCESIKEQINVSLYDYLVLKARSHLSTVAIQNTKEHIAQLKQISLAKKQAD